MKKVMFIFIALSLSGCSLAQLTNNNKTTPEEQQLIDQENQERREWNKTHPIMVCKTKKFFGTITQTCQEQKSND